MNDKNETPKIIRLVETDSTNNYLREQSAKARLPEGSLVIADFQTAGTVSYTHLTLPTKLEV